ncbi:HAD-superfamily hydrolase, subfamily IIA [Alkaliphilus metalliredigens QYMF]|uniref:Acid sugar phosphatase n=1 Tax=Alkaliphilus metalliredigens (strain QYMF) TaxID=293826 RepID=A6TLX1_ALKMQ|nr:HAD-IIA family hydrolase [Alkaliphilus metalliredigens]ABR47189.1 HAD-superfamily hydrolase, subfamily IIA [Alkaliphilus metalliredigens QYMF]
MDILKEKTVYLLDMDGTIYLGDELIDGSKEFLETIKKQGKRYIFLTNNSSKSKETYVEKLNNLGIQASQEEVFTSGEATTMYLKKEKEGANIYLLGTKALEEEFKREGFILEKERHKNIDYVVLAFDTTLTYEKLWAACEYISEGVEYIATHPDFNCPLPNDKFMPDAGAMAALIEASTGKTPKVIGKPNKEVVESIASKYGLKKEDMVMVGDRLYTDIKTGKNAGIASVLVYSGETKEEDYRKSETRADYVFNSVKEMIDLL